MWHLSVQPGRLDTSLKEKPKPMEELAEKSGLAYIPLFRPGRSTHCHRSESSDSLSSPQHRGSSPVKHRHPSSSRHIDSLTLPLFTVVVSPPDIITRSSANTPLGIIDSHLSMVVPLAPPPFTMVIPLTPPMVVPLALHQITVVVPLAPHPFTMVIPPPLDIILLDLAILDVIVPHQLDIITAPRVDIIPPLSVNTLPFNVVTAPLVGVVYLLTHVITPHQLYCHPIDPYRRICRTFNLVLLHHLTLAVHLHSPSTAPLHHMVFRC